MERNWTRSKNQIKTKEKTRYHRPAQVHAVLNHTTANDIQTEGINKNYFSHTNQLSIPRIGEMQPIGTKYRTRQRLDI